MNRKKTNKSKQTKKQKEKKKNAEMCFSKLSHFLELNVLYRAKA